MSWYRVDVMSVAAEEPLYREYFEADTVDQAQDGAAAVIAVHGTNPEIHYGDVWVQAERVSGLAEYVATLDCAGHVHGWDGWGYCVGCGADSSLLVADRWEGTPW